MLIHIFRGDYRYPEPVARQGRAFAPGFFVDVGTRCNFDCLFCSVERTPDFVPLPQTLELVEVAGRHSLGRGFFTGGEPSIYPHLERVMAHGNAHGVNRWGMSTNASGLTDRSRVRELESLGMRLWKLSWDDHRPEVLDELRGHRNVTELMLEVLEVLHELPTGMVSVYQVVVRQNYEQLPAMVEYLAGLRRRFPRLQLLVMAFVKPVESALVNRRVLFDHAAAVPYVLQAIDVARRLSFPLALNNVTACALPRHREMACSTWEHLGIFDTEDRLVHPMRFPDARLVKGNPCLGCRLFESCNGYFEEHACVFGDGPFHPTDELLRATPLPASALTEDLRIAQRIGRLQRRQRTETTLRRKNGGEPHD